MGALTLDGSITPEVTPGFDDEATAAGSLVNCAGIVGIGDTNDLVLNQDVRDINPLQSVVLLRDEVQA